jgi:hypothetical protein
MGSWLLQARLTTTNFMVFALGRSGAKLPSQRTTDATNARPMMLVAKWRFLLSLPKTVAFTDRLWVLLLEARQGVNVGNDGCSRK